MSETIQPRTSPLQSSHLRLRTGGFTLVEVLVVIGIIVILLSILIPVVSRVREAARVAQAQAQINSLTAAIQRYQQDHSAFPGPLSNDQVYRTGFNGIVALSSPPSGYVPLPGAGAAGGIYFITGTENLVLGLLGGLVLQGAAPGQVAYDPSAVGRGPQNLNFANPKRFNAYIEPINLSWRDVNGNKTGQYEDLAARAKDSVIPEFVDTFPEPMPILYLRARKGTQGATGAAMTDQNNPVITNVPAPGGTTQRGHYDLSQIIAYTGAGTESGGTSGTAYIGVGKDIAANDYVGGTPPSTGQLPHGLASVDPSSSMSESKSGYQYPYDAYAYFKNPASPELEPQPRQKDGYILIGAGSDRVYGTADDITSFGAVAE